jgi:hypothetical protein
MKRFSALVVAVFLLSAAPAFGVNDPLVPGDECSASGTAVGHPAIANNQTPATAANPPFSSNNPGNSTGARGTAHSEALAHCPNASA